MIFPGYIPAGKSAELRGIHAIRFLTGTNGVANVSNSYAKMVIDDGQAFTIKRPGVYQAKPGKQFRKLALTAGSVDLAFEYVTDADERLDPPSAVEVTTDASGNQYVSVANLPEDGNGNLLVSEQKSGSVLIGRKDNFSASDLLNGTHVLAGFTDVSAFRQILIVCNSIVFTGGTSPSLQVGFGYGPTVADGTVGVSMNTAISSGAGWMHMGEGIATNTSTFAVVNVRWPSAQPRYIVAGGPTGMTGSIVAIGIY